MEAIAYSKRIVRWFLDKAKVSKSEKLCRLRSEVSDKIGLLCGVLVAILDTRLGCLWRI